MQIDDNMIQDLINAEIKKQVENKLKQIGRETLKNIYKDAVGEQVRGFLREQKVDLVKELKDEINYDKDVWKTAVAQDLTDRLLNRIDQSFYDDNTWD